MAVIGCVKTAWAGTSGGPGVTQMWIRTPGSIPWVAADATAAAAHVRTFWDAIKAYLPNEIVLSVSPTVDQYEETRGTLTASATSTAPPAGVAGTDTGAYSMASGMKMALITPSIRDGRRVRGAVYLVPAGLSVFTATGSVGSAPRTAINAAGNTLRTNLEASNLELVVYSRFREAVVGGLPERLGAAFATTGIDTSEKGAILRGRRD